MRLEGKLMVEIHYKTMEEADKWDQVDSNKLWIGKVPAIETKVSDDSLP
jgi:hypothetical protein